MPRVDVIRVEKKTRKETTLAYDVPAVEAIQVCVDALIAARQEEYDLEGRSPTDATVRAETNVMRLDRRISETFKTDGKVTASSQRYTFHIDTGIGSTG